MGSFRNEKKKKRKKKIASLSLDEISPWNHYMTIYVLVQVKLMWYNTLFFPPSAWLNCIFTANIN